MTNLWVSPNGEIYEVGLMEHVQWATTYLKKKFNAYIIREIEEKYNNLYAFMLLDGWIKVSQYSFDRIPKVMYRCTERQKKALLDFGLENMIEFEFNSRYYADDMY